MTVLHPSPSRRGSRSAVAAAALLLLTACGGAASSSTQSGSSQPSASAATTTVNAAQTTDGMVLTGPTGHTVYVLLDGSGHALPCTGGCLTAWPPVTVPQGSVQPGSGVTATLSISTAGGASQLTVNNDPVYYFAGDSGAGEVNGQGLKSFGGTWYALHPDGTPLTSAGGASAPASAAPSSGY